MDFLSNLDAEFLCVDSSSPSFLNASIRLDARDRHNTLKGNAAGILKDHKLTIIGDLSFPIPPPRRVDVTLRLFNLKLQKEAVDLDGNPGIGRGVTRKNDKLSGREDPMTMVVEDPWHFEMDRINVFVTSGNGRAQFQFFLQFDAYFEGQPPKSALYASRQFMIFTKKTGKRKQSPGPTPAVASTAEQPESKRPRTPSPVLPPHHRNPLTAIPSPPHPPVAILPTHPPMTTTMPMMHRPNPIMPPILQMPGSAMSFTPDQIPLALTVTQLQRTVSVQQDCISRLVQEVEVLKETVARLSPPPSPPLSPPMPSESFVITDSAYLMDSQIENALRYEMDPDDLDAFLIAASSATPPVELAVGDSSGQQPFSAEDFMSRFSSGIPMSGSQQLPELNFESLDP